MEEDSRRGQTQAALFGRNLAAARKWRGLTQHELAARAACGLRQSDVSKFEQGLRWPSIPQLLRLARVLEVSLQRFWTGADTPGRDVSDLAIELRRLGVVDLHVPDARVPGAFRATEDVLAWCASGDRPDPRILEAIPAVLAWNAVNPPLLEAYSLNQDPRATHRLAWLADVALTIHHNHRFPGGFVDPLRVSEFMRRIRAPEEKDDLGYPAGTERLPPVSKRWNVGYAATLSVFHDRAKRLLQLRA